MTLIISCLTPKYIVTVSDRRLTMPDGKVVDDSANKAVVFHDKICFTYTGIARIGRQPTDEWILEQLIGCTSEQTRTAINRLKTALDDRIAKLREPNRTLTIVADVWAQGSASSDAVPPFQPWSVAITNYVDPVTRRQTLKPYSRFQEFTQTLPPGVLYAFLPSGQDFSALRMRAMQRNLVRAMRQASDGPSSVLATTVAAFMRHEILTVANANTKVGKNLMTTILYNRELAENKDIPNQYIYHDGGGRPIIFAPSQITENMAIRGFCMYPGLTRP